MSEGITITDVNAVLGIIFGLGALIVSVMNYLENRPKVVVELTWNMTIIGDPSIHQDMYIGMVTVRNEGRRPIYLGHVCIDLPKKYQKTHGHFLLKDGIEGHTYNEGDPPKQFNVDQALYLEMIKDVVRDSPNVLKKLRAKVLAGNKSYSSSYAKEPPLKKGVI